MLRRWSLIVAAVKVMTACGGGDADSARAAPGAEARVVHVYNWVDYIGKDTIADFEAKTGIRVVYDTYETIELLETKLLTGASGYDVVFPTTPQMGRLASAGALMELDKSKLGNLENLDPDLMRQVALSDPGNRHAIAYLWGTVGIAYNEELVRQALGTSAVDSWAILFEPANAAKLSACGLTLLDGQYDVFESVEVYLGTDPVNEDLGELASAEQVLKRVRPFVRKFDSADYAGSLATGETCIGLGWSGVKRVARTRQDLTSRYAEIEYVIPREGAPTYIDTVAIPANAPHPDNAHAFLDFLMQPEVIAGVSNTVGYANAIPSSLPFIDADLRNDPSFFPDSEVRARLHPGRMHSQEYQRELGRAWTRIKSGH
jgi:putrescine transport system substrate-binding protein